MFAVSRKLSPADQAVAAAWGAAVVPLRAVSSSPAFSPRPGRDARPVRAASRAENTPTRVLVVEPDERARSILEVALGREGYEVLSAESALQAIELLNPSRALPAVIVAESALPGSDGFQLCGQLRADQRTADIPVILLARKDETFNPDLAAGMGADDYLPKPLFVRDVVSLVRLRTAPRSLQGAFHLSTSAVPIAHLLRALLAGVRSGRLELARGKARVVFRGGRVIDAAFDQLTGEAALMRLLLLGEGEYTVSLGGPSLIPATFTFSLRELMSVAFPKLERWKRLVDLSVPLDANLAVDFRQLVASLSELPDAVNAIVRLFDGVRTVRDVVLDSHLDEVTTLEVATRLYAMGIVTPAPEASPSPPRLPRFGDLPEIDGTLLTLPSSSQASAEGWTTLPLAAAPQTLAHPAVPAVLDPELAELIAAFNIQPVVELRSSEPPSQPAELAAFARGEQAETDAGITEAVAQAVDAQATPLLLTQVVETPQPESSASVGAPRSVEEAFFAQVDDASPAGEELPLPTAPTVLRNVGVVAAVALLAGSAGLVAWNLSGSPAAPVAAPQPPSPAPAPAAPVQQAAPTLEAVPLRADEALAIGISLYDSGRHQEAAAALERAVELNPKSSQAWLMLGLASFDSGETSRAAQAADAALGIEPKNGRALMLRASVYLDQGQRERATADLERYLALEPNGPFAEEARQLIALPAR